ncbi:MAG TPA: epimerase, partial [bacterium]|nr:epimerase [bacterium]
LSLPFKAAYMFRPGLIQPMDGIVSKTKAYNFLLMVFGWLIPVLRKMFPRHVTTTRILGRAMLKAARDGAPGKWVESWDINALGNEPAGRS